MQDIYNSQSSIYNSEREAQTDQAEIGSSYERIEQDFMKMLRSYLYYKKDLYNVMVINQKDEQQSQQFKQFLIDCQCEEIKLVYVDQDENNKENKQYFYKFKFQKQMFILKAYPCLQYPDPSMRGTNMKQSLLIKLNIIKNIINHDLIQRLNEINNNSDIRYNYYLYETINDAWNNLEQAQEIIHLMEEQGCENISILSLDDDIGEIKCNTCFKFRFQYNNENYILNAQKKRYLQSNDNNDLENHKNYLFMQSLLQNDNNNNLLNSQILKVTNEIDFLQTMHHKDYIFYIQESYICSIADLSLYLMSRQKIFQQNLSFQLHYVMIGRIIVELSKIMLNIKQSKINLGQIQLHNILITQRLTKSNDCIVQIKLRNLQLVQKNPINIKQQMMNIILHFKKLYNLFKDNNNSNDNNPNSSRIDHQQIDQSKDTVQFLDDNHIYNLLQDNFGRDYEELQYLERINESESSLYRQLQPLVSSGNVQSIIHQINMQGIMLDNLDITASDSRIRRIQEQLYQSMEESSSDEFVLEEEEEIEEEEEKKESNIDTNQNQNQYQYNQNYSQISQSNQSDVTYNEDSIQSSINILDSTSQNNRYDIKNLRRFKSHVILRRLYRVNKEFIKSNNMLNQEIKNQYEKTSPEFQLIQRILRENGKADIEFVKLGQHSKHFFCTSQSFGQQFQWYVKVYKIRESNNPFNILIQNQNNAIDKISTYLYNIQINNNNNNLLFSNLNNNRVFNSNIGNNNTKNTQEQTTSKIEQQNIRLAQLLNPDSNSINNFILKHFEDFIQEGYRFIIYPKCLCTLRDLVPFLDPQFIELELINYNFKNLQQEIQIELLNMMNTIHNNNLVHLNFDLSKILIDKKGYLKMSNFQLTTVPNQLNTQFLHNLHIISKNELNQQFGLDETFLKNEISKGTYNFKLIKTDYFLMGIALAEFLFSIDYKRMLAMYLQSREKLRFTIFQFQDILQFKSIIPKHSYIFNKNLNIQTQNIDMNNLITVNDTFRLFNQQCYNKVKILLNPSKIILQGEKPINNLNTIIQELSS